MGLPPRVAGRLEVGRLRYVDVGLGCICMQLNEPAHTWLERTIQSETKLALLGYCVRCWCEQGYRCRRIRHGEKMGPLEVRRAGALDDSSLVEGEQQSRSPSTRRIPIPYEALPLPAHASSSRGKARCA